MGITFFGLIMKLNIVEDKDFFNRELKIIPDFLKPDENLIIAGGFAVHLYLKYAKEKYGKENSLDSVNKKFSDIDFFKIKDMNRISSFLFMDSDNLFDIELNIGKFILSASRTSKHANTFQLGEKSKAKGYLYEKSPIVVQGVKYYYEDIESMFSNFDLNICQIAISNNSFIFTDEFKNCIDNSIITTSKKEVFSFENEMSSLMFHSLRALKYSMRLDFKFDKFLSDFMMDLFVESEKLPPSYWCKDDEIFTGLYRTTTERGRTKINYEQFCSCSSFVFKYITSSKEKISFLINSENYYLKLNSINFLKNHN